MAKGEGAKAKTASAKERKEESGFVKRRPRFEIS
jgi:hypothetical protein